jgi:dipeptidyl aminopeptidase/acylaminoacyl peptidase
MNILKIALLLLVAVAAQAADVQPLTHETMWAMKRVGSPLPSPNGQWVLFGLTEPDYDSDERVSDLWIVPADGGQPPRRLTSSKGGEGGAAWSPDSRRIAFSAEREGDDEDQIYVLDLAAGGEAVRVTDLKMGASRPEWSPDGTRLLFHSRVYPGAHDPESIAEAAEERDERKYEVHAYDGFPVRYWDRWLDDRAAHLFVQDATPGAKPRNLLAGSELAGRPGFGGRRGRSGESLGGVWSPDGRSVVFAASVNRNQAAYARVVTHLYRVSTEGGEPEDLTPGPDRYWGASFSPDGSFLYALTEPTNGFVYNLDRLVRIPWPDGGRPELLTGGWDRDVDRYRLSPDGRTIYLQAEDEGVTKIFTMPADGGTPRPLAVPEEGCYSNLAVAERAEADVVLASWESHRSPDEIVRVDPATGAHVPLTTFNADAVARLDAQPARHFWFESSKGRRIHNLLILPPGFDESRSYPLVQVIHGGPHSASDDTFSYRWNYLLLASPGYVILTTNYTGSTGFGEAFARAIQGDPLRTPGEEIEQAADEAIARFDFIDGDRVAAGGASYGGHLSNWLQATTDRYRCLYSHAGLISLEGQWATSDGIYHRELSNGGPPWGDSPIWRDQSPLSYAGRFKTPVLVSIGIKDFRVPLNQSLAYWSALQRRQVPSRLLVFPRANHWISNGEDGRYFYKELLAWLEKYLGEE